MEVNVHVVSTNVMHITTDRSTSSSFSLSAKSDSPIAGLLRRELECSSRR